MHITSMVIGYRNCVSRKDVQGGAPTESECGFALSDLHICLRTHPSFPLVSDCLCVRECCVCIGVCKVGRGDSQCVIGQRFWVGAQEESEDFQLFGPSDAES